MTRPVVTSFNTIAPILIQQYERYLPSAFDESMSLVQKVNKVIEHLNQMGILLEDVVLKWNEVMEWILADGLSESVNEKLDVMATDGTLAQIINIDMMGLLSTLKTDYKTNLVGAINENYDEINLVNESLSKKVSEISVNVKSFGAKGDGITDDTNAIKLAITHYLDNLETGELFFPSGSYLITSPIDLFKNGRYIRVRGAGKRESKIVAGTNMAYMIKTWEENSFTSIYMTDIGVYMNELADIGIDGFKTIYSQLDNISVWGRKNNSVLIKLSSWCNKLTNSILHAGYEQTRPNVIGLLVDQNQSTNNLIVEGNLFENLGTAIKVEDNANDLHILKNTFDQCSHVLVAMEGLKHAIFHNNYVEACGGVNNIQFTSSPFTYTSGAYSRILHSAFILSENVVMGVQYPISIDIANNQFANCYKEHLVSVSGIERFNFENNDLYGIDTNTYVYDKLIYVYGLGNYLGDMNVHLKTGKVTTPIVYDNNYSAFYTNRGVTTLDEPKKIVDTITSKSRLIPKINNVPIVAGNDIVVNATDKLRVWFSLSEKDSKNPFRLIVEIEKTVGTKLMYDFFSGATNLAFGVSTATTTNSTMIHATTESTGKQYKDYHIDLYSDGNIKIKNVWLEVANAKNKMIQLV